MWALVLCTSLWGCASSPPPASASAPAPPPPEEVVYRAARPAPERQHPAPHPTTAPAPRPPVESPTIADVGQVTFAQNSARLDKASTTLLDRLLPMLRKSALRLEGHADRDETNAAVLSLERARAVRRYLVAKGVPAAQLVAAGYAATRCVAQSNTEENRRENRRVELVQPED